MDLITYNNSTRVLILCDKTIEEAIAPKLRFLILIWSNMPSIFLSVKDIFA